MGIAGDWDRRDQPADAAEDRRLVHGGRGAGRRPWRARRARRRRRLPVHARRRLRRPGPDGVVLWTRLAPEPLVGRRRHAARAAAGPLGGRAATRHSGRIVQRGTVAGRARRGAQRPRRGRRPRAGARVLLPLQGRRRGQPGRPHPHRAGRRRVVDAAARSRSPPASTTSKATSPPTQHMAARGPRPGRPPRRLHLRVPPPADVRAARTGRPRSARSTTTGTATRSTSPTPTCRPRTPRCPWLVTWDDHEVDNNYADARGRPATMPPEEFAPAGPPPTRRTGSTCRCAARRAARAGHAALPPLPFGRLADVQRARHPPVPHRPARRLTAAERTRRLLPERAGPVAHDARRRAARLAASTALARLGARWNVLAQQTGSPRSTATPGLAARSAPGQLGRLRRRAARRCSTGSSSRQHAEPDRAHRRLHANWVRNVPPNFDDLRRAAGRDRVHGHVDHLRRRPRAARARARRRPAEPAHRVPQQQPRLRPLRRRCAELDERVQDRPDGARARRAGRRRSRASWSRTDGPAASGSADGLGRPRPSGPRSVCLTCDHLVTYYRAS